MAHNAPSAVNNRTDPGKLKWVALGALVLQNSALILTMRYSRTVVPSDQLYITSTAVIVGEVVKLVCATLILFKESGCDLKSLQQQLWECFFDDQKVFLQLCVPALLYTVQNNLQYFAVSNLSAAVFQVLSQLKLLTTAVMSVLFLARILGKIQWFSLCILVCGVSIVQLAGASQSDAESSSNMTGFLAIVASSMTSAFCAVYLEKVLKSKGSIWTRNIQMATIGIVFGGFACIAQDYQRVVSQGFLFGYSSIVWSVIALQACGGLIVALVVKYADNILKGFATSLSIIVSSIISAMFLDSDITLQFTIGAGLVMAAVVGYTLPDITFSTEKTSNRATV